MTYNVFGGTLNQLNLNSGLKAPELVMDASCKDNSLLVHLTTGL